MKSKQTDGDNGIRPGLLLAMIGTVAASVVLVWLIHSAPSPSEPATQAEAAVNPQASASAEAVAPAAMHSASRPAPPAIESKPLPVATRLSSQEPAPDAIGTTAVPAVQGAQHFDYRAQAALAAELARQGIAAEESAKGAGILASSTAPTAPGALLGIAGTRASEPGTAANTPGLSQASASGTPAQTADARGGVLAPGVSREVVSSPSGTQASGTQVSDPTGSAQPVMNAVEAYREAQRIRRAYIEEMRIKRIAMIADARQREGLW